MSRILIAVCAAVVTLGCAGCLSTAPRAVMTQGERDFAGTVESLRLDLEPEEMVFDLGRPYEFRFSLRNVGTNPVEICINPGVSTRIRSGAGAWRILRLYGRPTDVKCPFDLRLDPGAEREFTESVILLSRDFEGGPAELQSTLAIELPQSCCSCSYGCAFGTVSGVHRVSLLASRGEQ